MDIRYLTCLSIIHNSCSLSQFNLRVRWIHKIIYINSVKQIEQKVNNLSNHKNTLNFKVKAIIILHHYKSSYINNYKNMREKLDITK